MLDHDYLIELRDRLDAQIAAYTPDALATSPQERITGLVQHVLADTLTPDDTLSTETFQSGIQTISGIAARTATLFPGTDTDLFLSALGSSGTVRNVLVPTASAGGDRALFLERRYGLRTHMAFELPERSLEYIDAGEEDPYFTLLEHDVLRSERRRGDVCDYMAFISGTTLAFARRYHEMGALTPLFGSCVIEY